MNEDLKPNLEPLEGRIVSGNYELSCALSTARQLRITGIIFSDENVNAVMQRVNNAQDVLDLQQVRMDIVAKEAQKAQQAYALEAAKDQMAQLLDKQKKGRKLTSAEQTQLRNMDTALVKGKEILASYDAAIGAAREKLNGAAPKA
jgi:hypothetical protein